ncbi:MAG: hypothetical protein AB8H79_09040 [Myxococcota bacterium]
MTVRTTARIAIAGFAGIGLVLLGFWLSGGPLSTRSDISVQTQTFAAPPARTPTVEPSSARGGGPGPRAAEPVPALSPGRARLVEELVFQGVAEVLECEVDLTDQRVPHTYDALRQEGSDLSRMTVPIGVRKVITVDPSGTPIHELTWDEDGSACTVQELPAPTVRIRLTEADGEPYVGAVQLCGSQVQTGADGSIELDNVQVDRIERGPRSVVSGCNLLAPGLEPQLIPVHGAQVAFQLPTERVLLALAEDGAAGGPDDPGQTQPNYTPTEGLQVILDNPDLEPEIRRLAVELLDPTRR